MGATGLSTDPKEYRARLVDQTDDQLGAWTAELMRDVAIRRGVIRVVVDFGAAAKLSESDIERAFTFGGGAAAVIGRDAGGHLMVPAITLHHLVPGVRALFPDAGPRLVDYLVANFDEIVFV